MFKILLVLNKQVIWLAFAVISELVIFLCNLKHLRSLSFIIGGVSLLPLIMVLIPGLGIKVNGAQIWLGLGLFRLQIAAVAKFGLVLVFSHYLDENRRYLRKFLKGFVIPYAMVGLVCLLVIIQLDFGTTFLCGIVGLSMMYLAGFRLKRLTAFIDFEGNKSDCAYQLWQGMLAFEAGGLDMCWSR